MTLPAMTLSSATKRRVAARAHDDAAAGQALADVVVRVALEPQRDAAREERAEGLAGRADEGEVDRVVGQAVAAVALGDLVAEHRADGAVDVADRQLRADRLGVARARRRPARSARCRAPCPGRGPASVVLRSAAPVGQLGHVQDRREVEARGLPVVDRRRRCRAARRGRPPRRACGSRARRGARAPPRRCTRRR